MAKKEKEIQPEIKGDYFDLHPEYELDSIIVAEDGTVFPGTIKGENAAQNYGQPYKTINKK